MKLEIIRGAYQFFLDSLKRQICEAANITEELFSHVCFRADTLERQIDDDFHALASERLDIAPSIADRSCQAFWDSLVATLPTK